MADDTEPITSPRDEKPDKKKPKKKKEPKPVVVAEEEVDGEDKGKCSCNTSFFLSIEGALKIIEFVSIYD